MNAGTVTDMESIPLAVSPPPSTVFIHVCLKKVPNKCTINLCFKIKPFVAVFGKLHLQEEQIGLRQNDSDTAGNLASFERPISTLLVLEISSFFFLVEFVNMKQNTN